VFVHLHINKARAIKTIKVMSHQDQIKLNDLQLLLDFHGKMQNMGMVSILLNKITALMSKIQNK
jgi:hypothetical protein